ncbi:pilus assembly PilX N-terminal domain-containing protein [Candidatus Gottesmanbacteria bacterium]|nr:pilus assembly PilX N-terminal domain-containing protein [Candidatus Gottesmanbacteria bacterium]
MRKQSAEEGQSGQIVLVALLVLTIALTIALSVIGRTTTDVMITSDLEESARAFNAAEAGIEQTLKSGIGGAAVLSSGSSYTTTVSSVGGAVGVYEFPQKTLRDVTETLWLVSHNADGTIAETPTYTNASLDVCWGTDGTPAIAASILYKQSGNYRVARVAYDPDATRRATNNFSAPTAASGGCGNASMYQATLTFSDLGITPAADTIIMVRVRPLYSETQLATQASQVLPLQGSKVESIGATGTGITRKVMVYRTFRAASSVFDNAVFSQGSFSH